MINVQHTDHINTMNLKYFIALQYLIFDGLLKTDYFDSKSNNINIFSFSVAFSSEIDKQPLLSLGRQLRPQDPYFVLHCLQELSKVEDSSSYRYVFIDCHNSSKISKALKVRSNIFDKCPYVFILKD